MKVILFCHLPYAFSIFKPLADALEARGDTLLWYLKAPLIESFPYTSMPHTNNLKEVEYFKSDAIFICGNDVPYWLHGLKVQIFHGLAGEKKGHFRIRHYFDLYLTQGPYFTKKFQSLAKKHKNFEVIETGWCKLDPLYTITQEIQKYKESLLKKHYAKKIILYAPTFSPSLTSAPRLYETILKLSQNSDNLILIKFHDKMHRDYRTPYETILSSNILIIQENDITQSLQIADIMISDTSSVVYEFTLLDKPVVTLNSISQNINWYNTQEPHTLYQAVVQILNGEDNFLNARKKTIATYHPYSDGNSAKRMIQAVQTYIKTHDIPTQRKLPLLRKWKMKQKYAHS
jgi:CDP-glycerol glycerophosphotransferase (TagB/SpsB family)